MSNTTLRTDLLPGRFGIKSEEIEMGCAPEKKHKSHIRFEPVDEYYRIYNVHNNSRLGTIEWYSPWRQYVFESYGGVVWSMDCFADVQAFVATLKPPEKR